MAYLLLFLLSLLFLFLGFRQSWQGLDAQTEKDQSLVLEIEEVVDKGIRSLEKKMCEMRSLLDRAEKLQQELQALLESEAMPAPADRPDPEDAAPTQNDLFNPMEPVNRQRPLPPKYQKVQELHRAGKDAGEIARLTRLGLGEVLMILRLYEGGKS